MSTHLSQAGLPAAVSRREPPLGVASPYSLRAVLAQASDEAARTRLPYAGTLSPVEAWQLVEAGAALLVDVRSAEERTFVGYVPQALHVAWATGTMLAKNPRFLRELEASVPKDSVAIFLCRSGKRSASAAEAATRAGWVSIFNVDEGFEGDLDARYQRGALGGWRARGLPWQQQ